MKNAKNRRLGTGHLADAVMSGKVEQPVSQLGLLDSQPFSVPAQDGPCFFGQLEPTQQVPDQHRLLLFPPLQVERHQVFIWSRF